MRFAYKKNESLFEPKCSFIDLHADSERDSAALTTLRDLFTHGGIALVEIRGGRTVKHITAGPGETMPE